MDERRVYSISGTNTTVDTYPIPRRQLICSGQAGKRRNNQILERRGRAANIFVLSHQLANKLSNAKRLRSKTRLKVRAA
eukprot:scaffold282521_cov17-Prasinocladus_malaysianus.AAC.1